MGYSVARGGAIPPRKSHGCFVGIRWEKVSKEIPPRGILYKRIPWGGIY